MATYTYSRQVSHQLEATTKAAESARRLASPIAAEIAAKMAPILGEGETQPSWEQVQTFFGRLLEDSADGLREVDESHALAEVDGSVLRQQRDEVADKLRQELRRARFLLDETLPKEQAFTLFPQRRKITTLDPASLVRLGRHIAGLLRGTSLQAKVQLEGGEVLNAVALLAAVEAATRNLEAVLAELGPKLREQGFSIDTRRQERKEALRTFRSTRELLRGFYRLAGFDYLADQLRDRRRKKAEEGEGEGAPEGEMTPETPLAAELEVEAAAAIH